MPSATAEQAPFRIVLGVAGGIAAYKSVEVLRRLRDLGYFVSPVLTPDATRFVGTVTFSALASEPARVSLYGDPTTPIPHTHLGQHADLIVVAPATAHLIARYAAGLADDLLTATLLASRAPVLLCPAMHTEMWEQPSVQENLATLRRRGVLVLEPASGALSGRRVLVSAGGTSEAIDPVRVVTNRSTGHQGFALAEVAARWGAQVTLVSAAHRELALDVRRRVRVVRVESAAQMAAAMFEEFDGADITVMAAAVADFSFEPAPEKIKKADGPPVLTPVATTDIVTELARRRREGQVVVAFAAETAELEARALDKRRRKDVDLVVANDVSRPGAGFAHPTNEVLMVGRDDVVQWVTQRPKEAIAEAILTKVLGLLVKGVE